MLCVLGVVFHLVYALSMFDCYFRSPLVHGMQPQYAFLPSASPLVPSASSSSSSTPSSSPELSSAWSEHFDDRIHPGTEQHSELVRAPANRLVLFVADGLRADAFFELSPEASSLPGWSESGALDLQDLRSPQTPLPFDSDPAYAMLLREAEDWQRAHRSELSRSLLSGADANTIRSHPTTSSWQTATHASDRHSREDLTGVSYAGLAEEAMNARAEQDRRHADAGLATRLAQSRAPFLRRIAEAQGRFGVSHTAVPTESRPGHVAMIAGFFEDVSAVTRGWKHNPVEFDSLFNRTRATYSWGSPDILPMFAEHCPQVYAHSYTAAYEDFASDAGLLDRWVLAHSEAFLRDPPVDDPALIARPQSVFFLHLLAADTLGHAFRPHSAQYLAHVRTLDRIVARVTALFERHFPDRRTAYLFTSDHGMSAKGSHGDGDPANTQTPLLVWGAGVGGPTAADAHVDHSELWSSRATLSESEQNLQNRKWGLSHLRRRDVRQVDIAPLMASLIGVAYPMNSLGVLPVEYLDANAPEKVANLHANAREILAQYKRKWASKSSTSLWFKPPQHTLPVEECETLLLQAFQSLRSETTHAQELCFRVIDQSLEGLQYFQTYDAFMLSVIVIVGYAGWIVYVLLLLLNDELQPDSCTASSIDWRPVLLIQAVLSTLLLLERHSLLYHLYCVFVVFFWAEVWRRRGILAALGKTLWQSGQFQHYLVDVGFAVAVLQLLVMTFYMRGLLSVACLLVALWTLRGEGRAERPRGREHIQLLLCCALLAIFPLLSSDAGEQLGVVLFAALASTLYVVYELRGLQCSTQAVCLFGLLPSLAGLLVLLTSWSLGSGGGLPLLNQLLSWLLLLGCLASLPLATRWLHVHKTNRHGSLLLIGAVFSLTVTAYILLSVAYEALFLLVLVFTLRTWLLCGRMNVNEKTVSVRAPLELYPQIGRFSLENIRITLVYLTFCQLAFFGTGNIASVSSFELSSTYRFVTVFNPWLMTALLILKVVIPFLVVAVSFRLITVARFLSENTNYFIAIALADVMSVHFFFRVTNVGSWLEIGTSISHFALSNANIVFHLLMMGLSHLVIPAGSTSVD